MSDDEGFLNDFEDEEWQDPFANEVPETKTVSLNIGPGYVPDWHGQEAFREAYQNWLDGMAKTARLSLREIAVIREDSVDKGSNKQITIRAYPRKELTTTGGYRTLLGYIKFVPSSKEKNCGMLEITNFGARLNPTHLNLGGTTKAYDPTQAGQHGEGLKLLAHIFTQRRYKFTVKIHTSSRTWRFYLDPYLELKCQIKNPEAEMKKDLEALRKEVREAKAAGHERPCKADVDRDVCLRIGESRPMKSAVHSIKGKEKTIWTPQIPVGWLEEWFKYILDLHPDRVGASIMQTSHGDLILDERFKGKLFLRTLFLPDGSASEKALKYGYNFIEGKVDRERRSMASYQEEARLIHAIWKQVLLHPQPESDQAAMLTAYVEMLEDDKVADVNHIAHLAQYPTIAEDEKTLACLVWKELLHPARGAKFYYGPEDRAESITIIQSFLRLEPSMLKEKVWKWLRAHGLCRTPNEERKHRFDKAKCVGVPNTSFARHVDGLLKACLELHPETEEAAIEWIESLGLGINIQYISEEKLYRIDEKWLHTIAAHESELCQHAELAAAPHDLAGQELDTSVFECDHLIVDLYSQMMDKMSEHADGPKEAFAARKMRMKSAIREQISSVPRNVQVRQVRDTMEVTWETPVRVLTLRRASQDTFIALHESDCPYVQDRIHKSGTAHPQPCSCASATKRTTMDHVKDGIRVQFSPLPNGEYVATVAKASSWSVFGLPSPPANFQASPDAKKSGSSVVTSRWRAFSEGTTTLNNQQAETAFNDTEMMDPLSEEAASPGPGSVALIDGRASTREIDSPFRSSSVFQQPLNDNNADDPGNAIATERDVLILDRIPRTSLKPNGLPWENGFPGKFIWSKVNGYDTYFAHLPHNNAERESPVERMKRERTTGDDEDLYKDATPATPQSDDQAERATRFKRARVESVSSTHTAINVE